MSDFQNNTDNDVIDYSPSEDTQPQGGKIRIIIGFLLTWCILGYGFYEINNLNNQKENSHFAKKTKSEIKDINQQNNKTEKQLSLNTKSIDVILNSLSKIEDKQRELELFSQKKTAPSKNSTKNETVDKLQENLNQLKIDTENFKKDLLATVKIVQGNLDESIKSGAKALEEQISLSNHRILSNNKQLVKLTSKIKEIINETKQNISFNSTTYTLLKLRNNIDSARSYNIELDILEKLTKNNPETTKYLTELKNILATNNSTRQTLENKFITIISNIKQNIGKKKIESEANNSFWGNVKSSISSKISVEKLAANKEEIKRINDIAQKTLISLKAGDLNTAIKESGKFNSKEIKMLSKWRQNLKNLYRQGQLFDKIYTLSNKDNISPKTHELPMQN